MKIGTKSILFGVHQFIIHPIWLAIGWWKEYGRTKVSIGYSNKNYFDAPVFTSILDPRLWIAFFVHDLGYIGKPNIDGVAGKSHPEIGAAIMRHLFGEPWGRFTLHHSRYYASKAGFSVSPLAIADKWAIVLEPSWFYLPRAKLSGELVELMSNARNAGTQFNTGKEWHVAVKQWARNWLAANSTRRVNGK